MAGETLGLATWETLPINRSLQDRRESEGAGETAADRAVGGVAVGAEERPLGDSSKAPLFPSSAKGGACDSGP